MQAVVSGQGAVGVAVSAIQLLSALASVKTSPVGIVIMEERVAEARSAFAFFALSTVFFIFSAGAYAWLTRTPEYREINGDNGTRRVSISLSQSFTSDGEGTGLVSGRSRDAEPNPVARTIAMIKTNLPFNFTAAWVFVVTLVRWKNGRSLKSPDIYCATVCVPADHGGRASDGPCDQPSHLQLPSFPRLQCWGCFRPTGLFVASTDHLVRPSFSGPVTPSHPVHPTFPSLQCSVCYTDGHATPGYFI